MRILILKLTATLALWIAGCSMPPINIPPVQPVAPSAPTKHELEITVSGEGKVNVGGGAEVNVKNSTTGSASADRCDCGCSQGFDCRCSSRSAGKRVSAADTTARSGPQIVSALRDSKPVVEMLSDFDAGQCGACDLAWSDWQANGASWPFVLVKRRGAGGRTSPTFVFPGREPWSPQTYSVGGMVEQWRKPR